MEKLLSNIASLLTFLKSASNLNVIHCMYDILLCADVTSSWLRSACKFWDLKTLNSFDSLSLTWKPDFLVKQLSYVREFYVYDFKI